MVPDIPLQDRLPPNQARGDLDFMDDDTAETDEISAGPLTSRFLSLLRYEHRPSPSDSDRPNATTNGDTTMTNGIDLPNGHSEPSNSTSEANKPLPPATALPSDFRLPNNTPQLSHNQMDDRIKQELRHLGILPPDEEPDYDAHNDDEVAERLRWLQARLKEVSIRNGACKRRILELAEEQLAYQEYSTILEDLDGQVQQAFLKRARTAGKSGKKGAHHKRPGGGGPGGMGVSKPGIGDLARQLMERRKRWQEKIGPVFEGDVRRVRGSGEGIFEGEQMERLVRMEKEAFEEEQE